MSELATLFSTGRKVKFGPDEVEIKQITLGDLPEVLKILEKYFEIEPKSKKEDIKVLLVKELIKDFASVKMLFRIGTNLSADQIDNLNLSAATLILTDVIKDNADFLYQSLGPVLDQITEKMKVPGLSKSKN